MADKVRTQIQIERRRYERLKRLAHERGQSMAEVVLEARFAMIGAGRDVEGKRDVARRHDAYLYGRRR